MALNETPRANRLHIGLFGKRNVGKSSLLNALTGQEAALVSDVAGTTTDPVYKAMELRGFGPVVFIDTAGFDDTGALGALRVEKTRDAALRSDVAVLVLTADPDVEVEWVKLFRERKIPVIAVINKADKLDAKALGERTKALLGLEPIAVSTSTGEGVSALRKSIADAAPESFWDVSILGNLAAEGDLVLLVMPQDIQAPKGRLILPQVQTLRELLDRRCLVMSCVTSGLSDSLAALSRPPKLIVTDSQAFPEVWKRKPPESLLTSFSVLYAGYKGDIRAFVEGAAAIDALTEKSHVLIAEACAHAPMEEDIGRVKIPRLLRRRVGEGLSIDFVRGVDFPDDLTKYDLVIHCGACMFTRRQMLARIAQTQSRQVPICNYGVALAHLAGILDKISLPEAE